MPESAASRKFSVIIANYNYGRFLKDCILSVLAQNYEAKDVILVDDGSTEATLCRQSNGARSITLIVLPPGQSH